MKRCFLYPGQGAQFIGMGRDLWQESDSVKELFAEASEESSLDLERALFKGDEEELKQTEITQVAVTLVNLAAMRYLAERGWESDVCAGFSLGEYSALVDAGILDNKDIFKIVRRRGEIMAEASNSPDSEPAGMAAVLGLDIEEAEPVFGELDEYDVYLANHSSPTQIVIAGTARALDRADLLFEKAGALKFVRLKVSGPFHSPLMGSARSELAEYLEDVTFIDPSKPVYANVTGKRITSGAEARKLCIEQIVSPVKWVDTEEKLISTGLDHVLEVGPGEVLSGLWKSFTKNIRCRPAGTVDAIKEITGS